MIYKLEECPGDIKITAGNTTAGDIQYGTFIPKFTTVPPMPKDYSHIVLHTKDEGYDKNDAEDIGLIL